MRLAQCPLYTRQRPNSGHCGRSELCHKQTHAPQQTASLFDHLVGAGEKRWRDVKSECFRGFDVDNEFEFDRL